VAILGGGPIGIELAVSAVKKGLSVTVLEKGEKVGANVRNWGHVLLFSNNSLNHSSDGLEVLKDLGNPEPNKQDYPTGQQFVSEYIDPLADFLSRSSSCQLRCGVEVTSVGRGDILKGQCIGGGKRNTTSFRILVINEDGEEELLEGFQSVVDATGSYGNHNWVGKGGIPALGEKKLNPGSEIWYNIPNFSMYMEKFKGTEGQSRITAVVGSGASAITSLKGLETLAACDVIWFTRRGNTPYQLVDNDALPQRDALYRLGNSLADGSNTHGFKSFSYKSHSHILAVRHVEDSMLEITYEQEGKEATLRVHNLVANVGYRPDKVETEELQVHYCYATDGPMKLSAALMAAGGGGGDCLVQVSPGPDTLRTPEPGFYIVGMKSYGRGSAFLLRIGHEQVKMVLELILGTL